LNEAHAGFGGELGGEFGDWFDYVDGFGDGGEEAFGYAADAGQRRAVFNTHDSFFGKRNNTMEKAIITKGEEKISRGKKNKERKKRTREETHTQLHPP